MLNIEFTKNCLYKPAFIYSYKERVQPLNVVKDPQKPNPRINLYFWDIFKALIRPIRKHPIIFTIKISFICHRNIAAGIAPKEIRKKVFLFIENIIYWLPSEPPKAKKMIPKKRDEPKIINALLNFNSKDSSNKS